jgi:hypothetical protein
MIWMEMFGSGAVIGTAPIIMQLAVKKIPKALKIAMIQRNRVLKNMYNVGDHLFAAINIVYVIRQAAEAKEKPEVQEITWVFVA